MARSAASSRINPLRLRGAAALLAALGMAAGPGGRAQTRPAAPVTIVVPPAPLLPETIAQPNAALSADQVARAQLKELTAESFDEASCLPVLGAGGTPAAAKRNGPATGDCLAILKEDGLVRLAATRYHHTGAADDAGRPVAAFEFEDATGAYSAYTLFRSRMHGVRISSADRKALALAAETSTGDDGTLIWSGTALLRSDGRLTGAETAALVATLPKASGRKAQAPLLPTFLPADGLDRANIRYALGPAGYAATGGVLPAGVIDWTKSAEAATAEYAGRGGKGELTLLLYPTPQIAGIQGRAIESALNGMAGPQRTARFGTIKLRRLGPLLGLTTGGFTPDRAAALVGAVQLNEQVTFDKPMPVEFHAEVKKTASLLQNIAVFIGVLLAAAILLALFLGGARAGIRVLMGKPAATEPEFLTINLRGRSDKLHFDSKAEAAAGPGLNPPRTPDRPA